jgi:hypothetical protein
MSRHGFSFFEALTVTTDTHQGRATCKGIPQHLFYVLIQIVTKGIDILLRLNAITSF